MRADIALGCLLIGIAFSMATYQWGYDDATAKAEADRVWVNEQMDKAGFCAWVRQSSFANHCARRDALEKERGDE